jgi:hypothetical protein
MSVAADREKQLMLRAGQTRMLRLFLAPAQEAPQTVAELEKSLEVGISQSGCLAWQKLYRSTIRSFYDVM